MRRNDEPALEDDILVAEECDDSDEADGNHLSKQVPDMEEIDEYVHEEDIEPECRRSKGDIESHLKMSMRERSIREGPEFLESEGDESGYDERIHDGLDMMRIEEFYEIREAHELHEGGSEAGCDVFGEESRIIELGLDESDHKGLII
jgi:hypothetical protein